MYGTIYVPVDNSEHSNTSVDLAVSLGKALGSSIVGSHVYAAKLHDVRFKQMEFTLPDEYKEEEELEKQRKIHDALIARGLHLISDSYLDQMETRCADKGLPFERKHFDGKNFEALASDIKASAYDLVVLGALGMGAVKDSQIGSVCERILRRTQVDTLVVRDVEARDGSAPGNILCCLDGSTQSYGALRASLGLAAAFGKQVEVLAVQDPARPEESLLSSHLDVARRLAALQNISVATTLVQGMTRREILARAAATKPWLLVAGRIGIDSDASMDIGSTTEALVRQAPCNVLVVSRTLDAAAVLAGSAAA